MTKKLILFFLFLNSCSSTEKKPASYIPASSIQFSKQSAQAQGTEVVISTQGNYATQAAKNILQKGGNLIDAFVAASFVISVERPQSTGIGGGGFLVFREAKTKKVYAIDFRERAPIKAKKDMYLDKNGEYLSEKSKTGALSAAVPGLVKGLWEVHQKFGRLSWSQVIAPAVELADNGFPIYADLEKALTIMNKELRLDPAARKIFLDKKLNSPQAGVILKQKDLAKTLRRISVHGADEFYKGQTAKNIVSHQLKNNGIMTTADLVQYQTKWRSPVEAEFLGYKIFSMPPPSSGGIHVVQFLKMLENEKWATSEANSAKVLHIQAAALQSAFADRATHLGDPDFYNVPQQALLNETYLKERRSQIPKNRARNEKEVTAGEFKSTLKESDQTTHMSMMDKEGNMISSTQTINGYMGSSVVVPGTGILMNNEMDDFSAKPGTANLFGAIGGEANAIAPQKTPLSSMSPTLVISGDGEPVMSVGAPGGTRIISCTAQTIFNYLYFKKTLWDSVTNIRYHHQWVPNVLTIELPGPAAADQEQLKKMGYKLDVGAIGCRVMATSKQNGVFTGVADPRDIGTSFAQ